MGLSSDLISQFVKATNDHSKDQQEKTVYGTIVIQNDQTLVRLDGSDRTTPITTTSDTKDGDRVLVLIKNHTATIIGNISSPSTRVGDMTEMFNKISEFEVIVAGKVDTDELTVERGRIDALVSDNALIRKSLTAAEGTIETLSSDNVTIKEQLTAAQADIENLETTKLDASVAEITYATIKNLDATNANVASLKSDVGEFKTLTTDTLDANSADIENLKTSKLDVNVAEATYAKIGSLSAVNGDISNLESDIAEINTLIFGSATGDTIQTSFANAVIAQLGNAQIKSAMIESISADKITAGDIITNNVRVMSEDGSLIISDETMQIKDANRVRVQIGKDAANDYSINIWDQNGNLMFSKGGITDSAIKSAIIRNDMVSETANIHASKLDIDSLFEEINGSTNTIKSARVYLDDEKQTLDVSFKTMTTDIGTAQSTADNALSKADKNTTDISNITQTVTTQGTAISTIQGQISSKIWQQDITTAIDEVNKTTNTLSSQYSELDQELDSVSSTVASHTTQIASTQSDLDSVKTRVSSAETKIDQNSEAIALRATKTELTAVETKATKAQSTADTANSTANSTKTNLANNYYTKTQTDALIKVESDKISSAVTRIGANETAISTLEQTADSLTVRLDTTDSNVTKAQSTANTANTTALNAAKTATNYLKFTSADGLIVGDYTASTLKGNIQLKAETNGASISLRDGSNTLVKFSAASKAFSGITSASTTSSSENEIITGDDDDTETDTKDVTSQTLTSNQTKSVVKFDSAENILFEGGIRTNKTAIDDDEFIVNQHITLNGNIYDKDGRLAFSPNTVANNITIGMGKYDVGTSSTIIYGNRVKAVTKIGFGVSVNGEVALQTNNSNGNSQFGFHQLDTDNYTTIYGGGVARMVTKSSASVYNGIRVFKDGNVTIMDQTGELVFEACNSNGNTTIGGSRYNTGSGHTNIYGGDEINLIAKSGGRIIANNRMDSCQIVPVKNAEYALGEYNSKGWSNIYLGNESGVYNGLRIIVDGESDNMIGRDADGRFIFGHNGQVMYYHVKNVDTTTTGDAFRFTSGNDTAAYNSSSTWFFGRADSTSRIVGSYLAYARTYSSAANMVVTANGVFGRSTSSSKRYKNNIVDTDISELSGLYDMPVKRFKYNSDYIATDDELYDKELYGFIVEDLEDILPCAVEHITDEEGNSFPEMWNSNIIIPAMLKLIQDLNNRVTALEGKEVI